MTDDLKTLADLIGDVPVRFWTCLNPAHRTVIWDGDLATCGVCGLTSRDTACYQQAVREDEREKLLAALEHTRIDRDQARAEVKQLRDALAAATRIELQTIRALIDALDLDPHTDERCVDGCAEDSAGVEHYVWHLTQQRDQARHTLARLRERADQEIRDAKQGEWFAGETDDGRALVVEQRRRGIWETVKALLAPSDKPESVTPDR